MEVTVKIIAPGLSEAILALAEQLQELNAFNAGRPTPTEPIGVDLDKVAKELSEKVQKRTKKEEKAPETEVKELETEEEESEDEEENTPLETVRALVVKSKDNKEKAKEIMTSMGIKKLTDLNPEQLNVLYAALQVA